jgi:hypothetical protein
MGIVVDVESIGSIYFCLTFLPTVATKRLREKEKLTL